MNDLEILANVDLSQFDLVAEASSRVAGGKPNWTELAVYYDHGHPRPWIADIRGMTTVPGQHNRSRRKRCADVGVVFEYFDPGSLADKCKEGVTSWLSKNARRLMARETVGDLTADNVAKGVWPVDAFDGQGLEAALAWLYPCANKTVQAERFAKDFGVPTRTLAHTRATEKDGLSLPSWCVAFLAALRGFDRRSLGGDA